MTDKPPERLFLQYDGEDDPVYEGQTWCADKINNADIEYIRLDLHDAALREAGEWAVFEYLKEDGRYKAAKEEIAWQHNRIAELDAALGEAREQAGQPQATGWKTIDGKRFVMDARIADRITELEAEVERLRFPKKPEDPLRWPAWYASVLRRIQHETGITVQLVAAKGTSDE